MVREGHLVERDPVRSPLPKRRHLYVTPEIADLLDGAGPPVGFPQIDAYRVTDTYMVGYLVCVSFTIHTTAPRAFPELERLEGLDEAWVICFRKPRPGWRLLGRFMARDHFVALAAYAPDVLKNRRLYEEAAQRMIAQWREMFGAIEPFRGDHPAAYLSGVVRDVSFQT